MLPLKTKQLTFLVLIFCAISLIINVLFIWKPKNDRLNPRVYNKNYTILRYPLDVARYHMIAHTRDTGNEANPLRKSLLSDALKRQDVDGLNTVKYKAMNIIFEKLYTWITLSINNTEIFQSANTVTIKQLTEAKKKWLREREQQQKSH